MEKQKIVSIEPFFLILKDFFADQAKIARSNKYFYNKCVDYTIDHSIGEWGRYFANISKATNFAYFTRFLKLYWFEISCCWPLKCYYAPSFRKKSSSFNLFYAIWKALYRHFYNTFMDNSSQFGINLLKTGIHVARIASTLI